MKNNIGFFESIKKNLTTNCFNFKGLATRRQYWYYFIFQVLLNIFFIFIITISCIELAFILEKQFNIFSLVSISFALLIVCFLFAIFYIYLSVSFISLCVRRIRDAGIENQIFIVLIMLLIIPFSFLMLVLIGIFPSQYFNQRI